jgi:choice-of-anchor C domain-containing protein
LKKNIKIHSDYNRNIYNVLTLHSSLSTPGDLVSPAHINGVSGDLSTMKKSVIIGIIMAVLLAGAGTVSAAPIVTNGGFETDPAANPFTPNMVSGLTGWTIGPGNIDLIGTLWTPASGAQSIDLSGSERGTISQTLTLEAGKKYTLSFAMAGNTYDAPAVKTVEVSWGGSSLGTFNFNTNGFNTGNMGWSTITVPHLEASSASTELTFQDVTPGVGFPAQYVGVALDDISVVEEKDSIVPVPEFPMIALPVGLIVGILGAVFYIRSTKED